MDVILLFTILIISVFVSALVGGIIIFIYSLVKQERKRFKEKKKEWGEE